MTRQRFVTGLKPLEPPPERGEADRRIVRAAALRSAARFAGTPAAPKRSTEMLDLAASFEAWVYRPIADEQIVRSQSPPRHRWMDSQEKAPGSFRAGQLR